MEALDNLGRNDPKGAIEVAQALKAEGLLTAEINRVLSRYQDTFSEAFVDELDQILQSPE